MTYLLKRFRHIAHSQSSEVRHFASYRHGEFNVRMDVCEQEFGLKFMIALCFRGCYKK